MTTDLAVVGDTTAAPLPTHADAVDAYKLGMLHTDCRRLQAEIVLMKHDLDAKVQEFEKAQTDLAAAFAEARDKYNMGEADEINTEPPFAIVRK